MVLWYPKDSEFKLIAYSDADHAGCKDDCKSTSGGLQFLGGKIMSWSSKKQDCTAMSTSEVEYVSLSACCAQDLIQERHKDKVGMQIPTWMLTEEMKHTKHYRMHAEVFGIDVPLTQSQPTESTQGTHRTPSAPRRSTRLTPPAPVPNVDKADEMILQDTIQVSLAEHKSREEQEKKKARENVGTGFFKATSEEIEKMVDGQENVVDDSSIPRNDESNILGTRIKPKSNKESPEVEITKDKEVEITKDKEVEITKETPVVDITDVVIPVNVNDENKNNF
ncbi:hypothetical protein Tco_0523761 [Tanacetum coccineum]